MILIAHRGASAEAPENTIAAFKHAIRASADLIELDVRLSLDGEVVVFHDRFLDRTTNGSGLVEDHTLAELKKLDAGSWFSPGWAGERIPTLTEVIRTVYPAKIGLYLELKVDKSREEIRSRLVGQVQRIVKKSNFLNRAFLASFDRVSLELSKKAWPGLRTGLIFRDELIWTDEKKVGYNNIDILCAHWKITDSARVAEAHRAGLQVFIWTVDRAQELRKTLPSRPDGVASNNPAWLVKEIGKLLSARSRS